MFLFFFFFLSKCSKWWKRNWNLFKNFLKERERDSLFLSQREKENKRVEGEKWQRYVQGHWPMLMTMSMADWFSRTWETSESFSSERKTFSYLRKGSSEGQSGITIILAYQFLLKECFNPWIIPGIGEHKLQQEGKANFLFLSLGHSLGNDDYCLLIVNSSELNEVRKRGKHGYCPEY